ncbi:MAG: type II toxin-antitoxin system Phd/YefM family antitoxin [Mangrovibacterium sp.]
MKAVNYSELRKNLKSNLDAVTDDQEMLVVHRPKGKRIVMMSLDEFNALQEILHLNQSKKNRPRLENAIENINSKTNLVTGFKRNFNQKGIMKRSLPNRMLVDRNFTPCPVSEDDELYPNGIFVFNITKMIDFIHSNPDTFTPVEVKIVEYHPEYFHINECHMPNVDLSEPVILAEIAPGRFNLVDGHHRMEKARRLGIKEIKAHRLYVTHLQRFLTEKKAYLAHVGYWNEKLNQSGKGLS